MHLTVPCIEKTTYSIKQHQAFPTTCKALSNASRSQVTLSRRAAAHKDAIAGCGGEVGRVVGCEAQALVRDDDGRLRKRQHVRHHSAIDRARAIADAEASSSLLRAQHGCH